MKLKLSNIAIVIVIISCFLIDLDLKNWTKEERVVEYDIHWYYAYLPAKFIYNDIELKKSDYQYGDNHYWFWKVKTADGHEIIKSTMGLAFMYAPFFFVAHTYAQFSDYPRDGFSEPYKIFLLLSAIFYLFVGLDFLKKILLHYKFSDAHIAITLLLLGLGTNLLCYSSQSAPMPHVYVFCLIAMFIYYTIKWYHVQSIKTTIILGFLFGLISLIRPSNVIIILFFLLYNVSNWAEFKERMLFLKKTHLQLISIALLTILIWVPQLIYWKIVTGHFIAYSYTDEGFFFLHPHIIDGLFSFQKGWLVYTPMMAFAIVGIFILKDNLKKLRLPIVLFLIINIYVIFSWWCWWYGGTYGQRSMIDCYALMAIPLATFVKFVSDKKWYYNTAFYCVATFFIWLNIFQTFQFENHSLHWDAMSKELYFKQFGKMEKIKDFDTYLSYPNYEEARSGGKKNNVDINSKPKHICLKTTAGKYFIDNRNNKSLLFANSDNPWEWETFEIIYLEDSKINIKASTGKFVSADIGSGGIVTANRDKASDWETFTLEKLDNDFVAIKAADGKYLSVDGKTFQITAKSATIGEKEKFILIVK
jgi:hypothetical protein